MPMLVAFDPGEVTGWSSWLFEEDSPMLRDDYGLIKGGLTGFLDWSIEHHYLLRDSFVVCEHLIPDGGPGEIETHLMIEGALAATLTYLAAPPPIPQTRTIKRQVGDDVLRRCGLWLTGRDPKIAHVDARDVNDSEIHALAWAKLQHHEPTLAAFWPES